MSIMSKMKDLAIREQEMESLDSLYDAKYWEVKDAEYEMYLNSEQYFDDIQELSEEDFINQFVKNSDDNKHGLNSMRGRYYVERCLKKLIDNQKKYPQTLSVKEIHCVNIVLNELTRVRKLLSKS